MHLVLVSTHSLQKLTRLSQVWQVNGRDVIIPYYPEGHAIRHSPNTKYGNDKTLQFVHF